MRKLEQKRGTPQFIPFFTPRQEMLSDDGKPQQTQEVTPLSQHANLHSWSRVLPAKSIPKLLPFRNISHPLCGHALPSGFLSCSWRAVAASALLWATIFIILSEVVVQWPFENLSVFYFCCLDKADYNHWFEKWSLLIPFWFWKRRSGIHIFPLGFWFLRSEPYAAREPSLGSNAKHGKVIFFFTEIFAHTLDFAEMQVNVWWNCSWIN